jgi:DNA-binding transcriptional regulator YiaG
MDTLTPMAELAGRWGITANTVSRRLAFLGIKPERQGNLRYITAEQLALGDDLQSHIVSGKPMELFPRADQPEGGLVTRRVSGSGLVTGQVEQMAAMAAAMAAAMPAAPVDPLRRAKALAEAAELGVALSSLELAEVLGMSPATVSSWADGHQPRPGFKLLRCKQKPGGAVWWVVQRDGATASITAIAGAASGRSVGFGACLTGEAVSLPCF